MEKIGLYSGSFDPLTNGHIDMIERSAKLFDQLIVVVSHNTQKNYLFTDIERKDFVKRAVSHLSNVRVVSHQGGLTVTLAKALGANYLVRGVRDTKDFDFEQKIAELNFQQSNEVETVVLFSALQYRDLSSSMLKEIAQYNGNIQEYVPEYIAKKMKEKYRHHSLGRLAYEEV